MSNCNRIYISFVRLIILSLFCISLFCNRWHFHMSRIKFRVQLQLKITLLLLFEINTIYFIPVQVILHYQLQNIQQCFPLLALLGTTLLFCPVFAVLLYVSLLLSLFFASSRSQILFGKKFIFNISLTLSSFW